MKRYFLFLMILIAISCSKDESSPEVQNASNQPKTSTPEPNNAPIIENLELEVAENLEPGTSLGFVQADDPDGDKLTYSIESQEEIKIHSQTGEITLSDDSSGLYNDDTSGLDYESSPKVELTISANDGKITRNAKLILNIIDIEDVLTQILLDGRVDEVAKTPSKLSSEQINKFFERTIQ